MLTRRFAWALRTSQSHPDFKITSNIYSHPLGCNLIHLDSPDDHKAFAVLFRTTPQNDSGVAHCLEHIALCGSRRFPVRDPFMKMLSRSLNSYMNAWTGSDFTMYPFSTKNEKDFKNLLDVYLDASFFPLIKYEDFLQEAWRLEWENENLVYKGVVFNEMKGRASDPSDVLLSRLNKELMPGTTYEYNSGGDPKDIPKLSYEELKKFHSQFYHPSNATFMVYGNVDIEGFKAELQEKVLKHFEQNKVDTSVKCAQKFTQPVRKEVKVPADPVDTDPARPCKFVVSYLTDTIDNDPFAVFALSVLSSALFDSQDSPMYKALLGSRLGSKYLGGTGFDSSTKQGTFTIGLNGVDKANIELIEKAINETLGNIAENGFDPVLIESSLHQIEIRNKEIKENYGLGLISNMIPFVLHGSDPLVPLYLNSYVKKLRDLLNDGKPVFQQIIKKYLLENQHKVTLVAVPENGFVEELNKKEEEELKAIQEKIDTATSEKIKKEAEMLVEAQNKEEDIDALPTLVVEDIEKKGKYLVYDSTEPIEGVKVNFIVKPTNGISYIRVKFNVKDLPSELRPYFPLYNRLINSLGTEKSPHNTFDLLKDLYTISGISSSILSSSDPTSLSSHSETFIMKIACLDRNLDKAFEIFSEFLNHVKFSEYEHIQNLIQRSVKSRTDNLLDSGTSYGSSIASSSLTLAASQYESLKTLNFDCKLASDLASALPLIDQQLRAIHSYIIHKQSCEFLVHTSDEASKAQVSSNISKLLLSLSGNKSRFPGFEDLRSPGAEVSFFPRTLNAFYTLPVQVNYVVQAFKSINYTHEDYPALKILCEIMSMKSLLKEVREKGGAYGASASVDSSKGTIILSSYRDPNNFSTFKAFKKAINYMNQGKFSQVDIDEGKLGVFGRVDRPVAIYDKGLYSFVNSFNIEMMERYRTGLLNVSKDEIVRVSQKYFSQASSSVIFGPEGSKIDSPDWSISSPIIKN